MYTVGSTGFWLKTNLLAGFRSILPGFRYYPQAWHAAYTFIEAAAAIIWPPKRKAVGRRAAIKWVIIGEFW